MELICETLCALALVLCGAFIAGAPRRRTPPGRTGGGQAAVPDGPDAPAGARQAFEDDLSALLGYRPDLEKEDGDEI